MCMYRVILLLFISCHVLKAQEIPGPDKPWPYPMRPGVAGWADVEDQYAAVQIPEEIYKKMSTQILLDSCLNFPLRSSIYFLNTCEEGFDYIVKHFGAMQELLSRADVGPLLIKTYDNIDLDGLVSRVRPQKYTFTQFAFLNQLIKRSEVLQKLDSDQSTHLAATALKYLRRIRTEFQASATELHAASVWAKVILEKNVKLPSDESQPAIDPESLSKLANGPGVHSDEITKILQKYR